MLFLINAAYAATDHNSSRSNKTSHTPASEVSNETEDMLKDVSSNASSIARQMIRIDQKDGYTGEYEVTVDVGVSIKRVLSPNGVSTQK
ncbi:MAG: hypothetical protein ACJAS9_003166 [Polaribacter sp.]